MPSPNPHSADWFGSVTVEELRSRQSVKWTKFGEDALACWVADMDYPIAPSIERALQNSLANGDLGYPGADLRDQVRNTFARRMLDRYQWRVDPEDTWLLTTVVQGIHVAISLFTEPGDGVIVQTPIYPPFLQAIEQLGRRIVDAPLGRMVGEGGDGYAVDPELLDASIDDDARMLLLCNPHNPTGRCFTTDELRAIGDVAKRRNLIVVADEIHQDLRYPGHAHHVFSVACPEMAAQTITLTSASKAFNLAGNRCAVIHFGSQELRDTFHQLTTRFYGEVSLVGHVSCLAAWTDPESQVWFDALIDYLDGNRRWLATTLTDHLPHARHVSPEGTYLGWVDLSGYGLGPDPSEMLRNQGRVALGSGPDFSIHGEGHVRVNMATSRPILEQVLDRVISTLGPAT